MTDDIGFIDRERFKKNPPLGYDGGWILGEEGMRHPLIRDDAFGRETGPQGSWSSEAEELYEEPVRNGWIDVYERDAVKRLIGEAIAGREGLLVAEVGASVGYMIDEVKRAYPKQRYVATDVMPGGLIKSYLKNRDVCHVQCDFTDAPIISDSVDVLYSLNVLEHIADDAKAIEECFRVLKPGGYCLFVVPRGEKLYDYFDEIMLHKRRYAGGELRRKALSAGFSVERSFHMAWMCYPLFWVKKKLNRLSGRGLSHSQKVERVRDDIRSAMASPLAVWMIRAEQLFAKVVKPPCGVRELLLLRK